jgi:hypothetical protein
MYSICIVVGCICTRVSTSASSFRCTRGPLSAHEMEYRGEPRPALHAYRIRIGKECVMVSYEQRAER